MSPHATRRTENPVANRKRQIDRRQFLRKGLAGLASIGISRAGFEARAEERSVPAKKTSVETRPASTEAEAYRRLELKRAGQLNPLVMQNLVNLEKAFDHHHADFFRQFNRFGKEQGGYLVFNQAKRGFSTVLVEDFGAKRIMTAIEKAKSGDFSQAEIIKGALHRWDSGGYIKSPTGKNIKITSEYLLGKFSEYQKLWDRKKALDAQGEKTEAAKTEKEIKSWNQMFRIINEGLVSTSYDPGGIIANIYPREEAFSEKTEERFFAIFHTHPLQKSGGTIHPGGKISGNDFESTLRAGPMVVFELGEGYNAIHVGVNGKIVLSKKYPAQ